MQKALEVAYSLQINIWKASALTAIVNILVGLDQHDMALEVTKRIMALAETNDISWDRERVLEEAAVAMTLVGRIKVAIKTMEKIKKGFRKLGTINRMVWAIHIIAEREPKQAKKVIDMALNEINRKQDYGYDSKTAAIKLLGVLEQVITAYSIMGDKKGLNSATSLMSKIIHDNKITDESEVINDISEIPGYESNVQFIGKIRSTAMINLAKAYMSMKDFNMSKKVIEDNISDNTYKDAALLEMVRALCEHGSSIRAARLAEKIQDDLIKALALVILSSDSCKRGDISESTKDVENALTIVWQHVSNKMDQSKTKNNTLSKIAGIISQSGKFDVALNIAYALDDINYRFFATADITKELVNKGQYDQAMSIWSDELGKIPSIGGFAEYQNLFTVLDYFVPIISTIDRGKTLWKIYKIIMEVGNWRTM